MGVAGLWDILRPAGQLRSLTHLSVKDGFEANPDGKRGFRIGIDASIWFYHAAYGKEGENPELRTLFFRCARLMEMPFLPVFVFDGPKRPDMKRGKRITGKNHWLVQGMQEIITAFGFEWRMAPGEAEAELAYLNRIGVIDAILSDDVDTFLFGAKMVIRKYVTHPLCGQYMLSPHSKNATLSGNKGHDMKNSAGKDDGNHAMVYRSSDILNREDIQLTQGGLILIGVLRGGDYCQEGLEGCGPALAHGLAKCGFGDTLLAAARTKTREELDEFLDGWRDEIRAELRTNARGHLPRKSPKLSRSIPDDFPNVDVVLAYTTPVTSEAKGRAYKNAVLNWDKEPDLGKIAALCEMYFEWGLKDIIIKRFRNVLWPCAVLRILRRAAILKDRREARLTGAAGGVPVTPRKNGKERRAPPGTPSSMIARHFSTMRLDSPHGARAPTLDEEDEDEEDENPLIVKIHSSRQHASTDKILEYRLEVAPAQLVRLCEAGLKGLRTALPPDLTDSEDEGDSDDDEGGKKGRKKTKKPPPDPDSHLRIWLPACMVEMVEPEMVDEFEGVQKMKADKKAAKGAGKKGAASKVAAAPSAAAAKKGKKAAASVAIVEEEEESSGESSEAGSSKPIPPPKAKALPPAKKTSKPTAKDSGSSDKAMDDFFMAKKPTAAAKTKAAKATTSTAARVADLFKDPPASPKRKAHIPTFLDTSDDDEVPRPPILSRVSAKPTTTSFTKSVSPSKGPSRILSLLDTTSHASKAGPSSQAGPSRPKFKAAASAPAALASTSASASASTSSPTKPRAIRPFPMELDFFKDNSPQPSPVDEDLFTTDRVSSGSGSGYGFGSGSRSSSARTRSHSTVSSDSDTRESVLQKSPRRSEKHASPRGSPSKQKAFVARREEEEEDSGDDRPPSPSPVKGRLPTTLSARAGAGWEEEEEESDRAPSPSPARKRILPPVNKPLVSLGGARKHTPLPADLSIISISSDGSEDELPPPPPPRKMPPLQQARARLGKTASTSSSQTTALSSTTTSSSTQTSRKAPQRIYNPDDIIDLT
ncbi:Flap endonuclease GEN -like protein [Trametes pubescens]|uniref:Flap endonuclease GEN-like protein n=1 Tax=Trametes pubescens TaxID=154538 RepID=A0A1M2VXR8_TRAPU|nr:Flap endonuclease GEN -like protein [Trametes pubescens]